MPEENEKPQEGGGIEEIQAYLEDEENASLKKPLLEIFEWCSNRSVATLMSALTGSKIAAGDVRKFKAAFHLKSFHEAQAKIDVTQTRGANEWFLLDAIHKTRLSPGATGSMAALQALKNIQDIDDKASEQNPAETILSSLLEWLAGSPEFSAEQKQRVAGELERIRKSLDR